MDCRHCGGTLVEAEQTTTVTVHATDGDRQRSALIEQWAECERCGARYWIDAISR